MFEDALFATNHRRDPQQRWAAMMSFVIQATFVTVIVGLPLFFTEALPLSVRITELPTVPRSPGPPPTRQTTPMTPAHAPTSEFVNDQLVFIHVPKGKARTITDVAPPAQPCTGACVVGAPPGPSSSENTLMDTIIGDAAHRASALKLTPAPKPVIVSRIDEGLLIHKVTPVYPQLAQLARQQGTVVMHAIIGRDGGIQQLQVISGPGLLVQAAMDAVRQWRYRPYILNGVPVEVDTQITVNFKLGS
jgi:protein TonB